MACIFGHKWNGCKCTKCGKTRDEGHDWNFCKGVCRICGKTRTPSHRWNGCICADCGKKQDRGHEWDGCKCRLCGKTRDRDHQWVGCKCKVCGATRDEGHRWKGCKCTRCGKIRNEGHEWDGCTCTRCGRKQAAGHIWKTERMVSRCVKCGMKRDDSYEYAVEQMQKENYESAIRVLDKLPAFCNAGEDFTDKIRECISLIYERDRTKIEANDYRHFSTSMVDYRLDRLESLYMYTGAHPLYDQLMEQAYEAFKTNLEKKDYQSASGWYDWIRKPMEGKQPEMNRLMFAAAGELMHDQDYQEAVTWLNRVTKGFPGREDKLAECRRIWNRDPRNPLFCSKSPDGSHQWEVATSVKTIDAQLRQAGHGTERCKYCGKRRAFSYDYDTDAY